MTNSNGKKQSREVHPVCTTVRKNMGFCNRGNLEKKNLLLLQTASGFLWTYNICPGRKCCCFSLVLGYTRPMWGSGCAQFLWWWKTSEGTAAIAGRETTSCLKAETCLGGLLSWGTFGWCLWGFAAGASKLCVSLPHSVPSTPHCLRGNFCLHSHSCYLRLLFLYYLSPYGSFLRIRRFDIVTSIISVV